MSTSVSVNLQVVGPSSGEGAGDESILLEAMAERVSVRELIARVVREHIRLLEARWRADFERIRGALDRHYLTRAEITESAQGGKVAVPRPMAGRPPEIDAEGEVAQALRAFARKGFTLIVGGRQVSDLDEELDFAQQNTVVFLRLIPLVGG